MVRQGETAVAENSDKPGKKETSKANGKKQPQSTDTGEVDHMCFVGTYVINCG